MVLRLFALWLEIRNVVTSLFGTMSTSLLLFSRMVCISVNATTFEHVFFVILVIKLPRLLNNINVSHIGSYLLISNASQRSYSVIVRYFIPTNATSTFRSIVSSYPGNLLLVSIQVQIQKCHIRYHVVYMDPPLPKKKEKKNLTIYTQRIVLWLLFRLSSSFVIQGIGPISGILIS